MPLSAPHSLAPRPASVVRQIFTVHHDTVGIRLTVCVTDAVNLVSGVGILKILSYAH